MRDTLYQNTIVREHSHITEKKARPCVKWYFPENVLYFFNQLLAFKKNFPLVKFMEIVILCKGLHREDNVFVNYKRLDLYIYSTHWHS